ncbi:MAG TPA: PrsW family glutamic-type intramembrane protease [Candidatus Paceibacterota bacterium]
MITTDPKILGLAFLGGMVPALLWLWFWLKQEEKRKEPSTMITAVFILGMLAVIVTIPIQKYLHTLMTSSEAEIVLWAAAEELLKLLAVMVLLYRNKEIDQPIDWAIYFVTVGLGFAALENALFLITPLSLGQDTVTLLTGSLRYLGSTLLHGVTSGLIGIGLGLSFFMSKSWKKIYLLGGIVFATGLHSIFNFFIIKNDGADFLRVFAFLWVVTVVVMLLFEKVRRMSGEH